MRKRLATSMNKVFKDIALEVATGGDRLKDFARIAGMTSEAFSKAFQEDASAATLKFVEGLGAISERGGNTIKVLSDLGIEEERMSTALLALASSGDGTRVSLKTAQWPGGTIPQ